MVAKGIELSDIRAFIAVAEEMHFGRAALRLGVSQPPLSRRIMILERALGVPLFVRDRTGIRLTKSGQAALREAYRLMEQSNRLQQSARSAEAGESCVLTVGYLPSAFHDILPALLTEFYRRRPDVDVVLKEFRTTEALKELRNGRIDVAFLRTSQNVEPLQSLLLRTERCVVALPIGHALENNDNVRISDLAFESLVVPSSREFPHYFNSVMEGFRNCHTRPRLVHEAMSIASLLEVVASRVAVSLVPASLQDSKHPEIVFRQLVEVIPIVDLSVAWSGTSCSPAVNEFIDIARTLSAAR